ncbi:hypothetical protein [Borreliella turdi]|uniref:hypothetical protein n=1 Tax=Borreliella turdi TaxID=57863 RepID=UPI001F1BA802|nr:hypothetical protein [Borreliella turdi]
MFKNALLKGLEKNSFGSDKLDIVRGKYDIYKLTFKIVFFIKDKIEKTMKIALLLSKLTSG